jgi:hypothetical protein
LQEKARQEVLDVLGDEKDDAWPTLEQLKNLHYLSKVMKEVRDHPSPRFMVFNFERLIKVEFIVVASTCASSVVPR